MKSVVLLCTLAVAIASNQTGPQIQADKDFVTKQLGISTLFFDNHLRKEVQDVADTFNFEKQAQNSNNPEAVKIFQKAYQSGQLLSRDEVFNYYNPQHLHQAIQIFDVLFFAKDFATFYPAATWLFNNVNYEQFAYALSVAVLNRADTQGVVLPPRSEFYSYLYVDSRAIREAHRYKQQQYKSATVQSNSTNYYYNQYNQNNKYSQRDPQEQQQLNYFYGQNQYNQNQEGQLSYFTEDVGFSSQFAHEQLKNPAWLNSNKYNQKQVPQNKFQNDGESYYYYIQQILARYNLERYANDLPQIQSFQFGQYIKPGYKSHLHYLNGQAVPGRANYQELASSEPVVLQQLWNVNRRITDSIDANQVYAADGSKVKLTAENGIQILGNIVQNNGDSVNNQFYGAYNGYYGLLDLFRKMIGSISEKYGNAPGPIQTNDAALKDPAFYQVIARVIGYFQKFKRQLKPYNQEQLAFPGVQVQSVSTDKLVTYFDNAVVDLYNVIYYEKSEVQQKHKYNALQQQLNSKPFNYQIQVNSDKAADAIVRVFIGPKFNNLEQARQNFVEIDRFVVKLNNGQNNIQRNSQQSTRFYSQQQKTLEVFVPLMNAYLKGGAFFYNPNNNKQQASFPANLILPKGKQSGQEYVFAVVVSPFQGTQDEQGQPEDKKPQGFPFDRPVRESEFEQAQNVYFQTVQIYNKDQSEVNAQPQ